MPDEIRLVAIHPALLVPFEGWLATRDLELREIPFDVDAAPPWRRLSIVTPTDEALGLADD